MALTGRKVFLITATAFGVIIGVNVVLAVEAVRTFPGLEVANSYVASQTFDADRRAQEGLGWTVAASVGEGRLRLAVTGQDGAPVRPAEISAMVGRATERGDDRVAELAFDGTGYDAPMDLGRGYWNVWVEAKAADGTAFRQRLRLWVRG